MTTNELSNLLKPTPKKLSDVPANASPLERVLVMWQDPKQLETIKKIYAPKATEGEFQAFVQMGIATGLNPFLREIWLVKFDEKAAAQIFIGRDGYRKLISRNPQYNGHTAQSVYSNDEFHVDLVNVQVKHVMNLKDRGKLMGAYSIVYMKHIEKPYYVWVDFDEYNLKRSVWNEKPATMIKKVAECQAIRMADQSCSGTYAEEEGTDRMLTDYPDSKSEQLSKRVANKGRTIEGTAEKVNPDTGEVTSENAPSSEEPKQEAPANDAPYTFEQLRDKMSSARSTQELNDAASLISQMGFDDQKRGELKTLYNDKMREIRAASA